MRPARAIGASRPVTALIDRLLRGFDRPGERLAARIGVCASRWSRRRLGRDRSLELDDESTTGDGRAMTPCRIVAPAENSSNASPGPTGNPSGSDCAHGGGTGWPTDSGIARPGPARLEPRGDRLPVGRTAGQLEAPDAAALRNPASAAESRAPAAPSRRHPRRPARAPPSAGSWVACSRACRSLFKNVCRKVESRWL